MRELLRIPVFARAFVALFASGISFPLLGLFILTLELVPVRFGVMHVSLLGAAVGLTVGADPVLFAMLFSIGSGFLIAGLSARGSTTTTGGSLGLVMTSSLGIAFLLFYKAHINAIEAFNLFWGNVLALGKVELVLVVVASALILAAVLRFSKPISAVLFDRETAFAFGFPSTAVYIGILVAVCAGIGLAMQITGALMVDAVTLLPALAAQSLKKKFGPTLVLASVFGVCINMAGFAAAIVFDLPTSPAMIVVGTAAVLICKAFARFQRR
jgi:zinc transport system permease protein